MVSPQFIPALAVRVFTSPLNKFGELKVPYHIGVPMRIYPAI